MTSLSHVFNIRIITLQAHTTPNLITVYSSSSLGSTALLLGLDLSFSLLILYTVDRTPWTGDQPVARPLPTHRTTHRINAHKHPCFQWDLKQVHDLDRAAAVIGIINVLAILEVGRF
jgi:hypothetical protein